jgi:hypothetical protein
MAGHAQRPNPHPQAYHEEGRLLAIAADWRKYLRRRRILAKVGGRADKKREETRNMSHTDRAHECDEHDAHQV